MTPTRFVLCFEAHCTDRRVWAIRVGRRWFRVASVHVWVDVDTVYRGPKARQPRAYLEGIGVVRIDGASLTATISPA